MELKNNCLYLGIPPLAGSVVVLCDKGRNFAEIRIALFEV